MLPAEFIKKIITKFNNELFYYTHPDVLATAHQVGTPFKESWTKILCEMNAIQRPESIERYTELERTLSSLYCFELCLQDNTYETFTAAQAANPSEMLTKENYAKLCQEVRTVVNNKDKYDALTCLITYSDLGKSPATRALAQAAGIDPALDTDDLMLEILKLDDQAIAKILPSFANLSNPAKEMLRTAYPIMTACFGHLFFLEGGPKTLETIAKALQGIHPEKRKALLHLVFLAQFYDGVGSQGQFNIAGSVTCTNNFYKGYMLICNTLQNLERHVVATNNVEKSVAESLDTYLDERARWLQLDKSKFRTKEDFELILRLACTLRIFEKQHVKQLIEAFDKLPSAYQTLLTGQLSFNSEKGINAFARTPHYVATAALNNSRKAFNEKDIQAGIKRALDAEICLAMLIKEISDNYPDAVRNNRMPMSFGKIAIRANEPNFFNPQEFDATLARWALPRPQPTGPIKNLIFDLGHVFIKIDTTRKTVFRAFSALARDHGKKIPAEAIEKFFLHPEIDEIVVAFHRGKLSMTEFRSFICSKLDLAGITDQEFDKAFDASILASAEEVKHRLAHLDELVNQGYNIYLLSNNNEIHRIHTKQNYGGLNWGKYFFKQYYSNETGLYKPDAESYMQILQENQLKPNETVFFDDVLKYIDAAWKYGIRARQFTVNRQMSDIPLIIDAINKNEQLYPNNVTRQSTLSFFAAAKFKKLLHHHQPAAASTSSSSSVKAKKF